VTEGQIQKPASAEQLIARARSWLDIDEDSGFRVLLQEQLESVDIEALRAGFEQPLAFGTAGLRGEVGPGPSRINLETISQVSWALAQFLCNLATVGPPLVVIGFDARPDSERFAGRAAQILSASGVRVLLTDGAQPTPLIAFAVRDLKASAGVVVTASHNPRPDNGYKVYDDQGIQIVSPWDTQISEYMARFPGSSKIPRNSLNVKNLESSVIDRYFSHVDAVARRWVPEIDSSPRQRIAYTPLHGVGFSSITRALRSLPIELLSVPEQVEPDGRFPTLAFPNPEEPGALDLLIALAKECDASAAVANDPDADRFALCLPLEAACGSERFDLQSASDELTRLSGDALGLLLADLCLSQPSVEVPCIVSTVVSTPALEELAHRRGGRLERTLTGFKWLCRAAIEQPGFVFAYEEALGYCLAGDKGSAGVMDKDGISALVTVARLISHCGGGKGLAERLLDLYCELGLWGSFGHSRRFSGSDAVSQMDLLLEGLRHHPPTEMSGMTVTSVTDFEIGAEQRPWYLGAQNLIQLDLRSENQDAEMPSQGRVLIRPSGTEPKVKVYVHLRSTMREKSDYTRLTQLQATAARQIADFALGW
jgi:phosphomannomutase